MGPTDATIGSWCNWPTSVGLDRPLRSVMDKAAICPAICEGKKRFQVFSGYVKSLLLKMAIYSEKIPLRMVIFHSYVKLPEGTGEGTRTGMMSIHLDGFWFYLTIDQMENYQWSSTSLWPNHPNLGMILSQSARWPQNPTWRWPYPEVTSLYLLLSETCVCVRYDKNVANK